MMPMRCISQGTGTERKSIAGFLTSLLKKKLPQSGVNPQAIKKAVLFDSIYREEGRQK